MISSEGPVLRIATRGSALALWQSRFISSELAKLGINSELEIIKTTGDRIQDRFLHEIGGKGLFVKELEESLKRAETDLAMHSLKDMPARLPNGYCLAAILKRHSPLDAVVFAERHNILRSAASEEILSWLKSGPLKIATSSLRRRAILQRINPRIDVVPIRGNVDTRLKKLRDNHDWDGLILAEASLDRLSLKAEWPSAALSADWFLPSPSQGALAIEMLETHPARARIAQLNCDLTSSLVGIERSVLAALGGDCTMPFAAYARIDANHLKIDVQVFGTSRVSNSKFSMPYDGSDLTTDDILRQILAQLHQTGLDQVMSELNLTLPLP
jgi:hydroxymethylbilane synthase